MSIGRLKYFPKYYIHLQTYVRNPNTCLGNCITLLKVHYKVLNVRTFNNGFQSLSC
jgi:hypothetical protein